MRAAAVCVALCVPLCAGFASSGNGARGWARARSPRALARSALAMSDATDSSALEFGPLVERYLEAKFKVLDQDGNGVLDDAEMKSIAGAILPRMDSDKFEVRAQAFTDSFKSSKGGVSLEDFKAGARTALEEIYSGPNAGVDCKEQVLIDTIQIYYADGVELLANDDFDALKEELTWAGSAAATLSRDEITFLEAAKEYRLGKTILSDVEYDKLKQKLKAEKSMIIERRSEPVCSVADPTQCSVTFDVDDFRTQLLKVPGLVISTLVWVGGFDLFAFIASQTELANTLPAFLFNLNPLLVLVLGTPIISALTSILTESVIFKKPLVTVGKCPSCTTEMRVFFGDILGVEGYSGETAQFDCMVCKTKSEIVRETLRASTVPKPAKA